MAFDQIAFVMVTVSDMNRSVEFYRDKLGVPLKFDSPEWTEFQTGATTLALHSGGKPRERPTDPHTHYAGTCSISFHVDNLDLAYEELKANGVAFVMAPTVRGEEGIKLAVAIDPDGLPISLAETIKT